MLRAIKHILIGEPLSNRRLSTEKIPVWKALAIFSSDALSSVAYGPEQIVVVLMYGGLALYGFTLPISLAILGLLAIVSISYSQVVRANPGGGGSYSVAKKNLNETMALIGSEKYFVYLD
ncbi:hypothetical protein SAMN02746089_01216 [Caldanaerobius fijiensis DSM 17918]|uniref:Amino acid permease n=1 Tax=Caldanaerobius fijiensis DSM 17918 TaxID=1121256 RepID=A0A1M4YFA5_9THEO|nr:hypothetical protein [Caldanaerobius fijiensis]SHF04333.1 hypothetical protein SAMN02746089_01216 [Caldanaerobius fijiensis DSM 17918]